MDKSLHLVSGTWSILILHDIIRNMRERRFRIGDRVTLDKLAVDQNEHSPMRHSLEKLYACGVQGTVVQWVEHLPDNSNFRYAVAFGEETLVLNETQLRLPTG